MRTDSENLSYALFQSFKNFVLKGDLWFVSKKSKHPSRLIYGDSLLRWYLWVQGLRYRQMSLQSHSWSRNSFRSTVWSASFGSSASSRVSADREESGWFGWQNLETPQVRRVNSGAPIDASPGVYINVDCLPKMKIQEERTGTKNCFQMDRLLNLRVILRTDNAFEWFWNFFCVWISLIDKNCIELDRFNYKTQSLHSNIQFSRTSLL